MGGLAAPGCCWLLLTAPGCSWLLLAVPGCSWLLLAAPGCFWLLVAASGCSWLLRLSGRLSVNMHVCVFTLFQIYQVIKDARFAAAWRFPVSSETMSVAMRGAQYLRSVFVWLDLDLSLACGFA